MALIIIHMYKIQLCMARRDVVSGLMWIPGMWNLLSTYSMNVSDYLDIVLDCVYVGYWL